MAERKQPIEGIFSIQVVVRPMSMKATVRVPKCVDQVEAAFVDPAWDAALQTGERMQGSARREEIGNGRTWHSDEAALRVSLCQDPVADRVVHGETQVSNQRDSRGSRIQRARFLARQIRPGMITSFQPLQTADQVQDVR